jgi:hypothetical protein
VVAVFDAVDRADVSPLGTPRALRVKTGGMVER